MEQLLPQLRWLVDADPTPADLEPPASGIRPDGTPWSADAPANPRQQRLIWLPSPEQQRQQAQVKAEMGQLAAATAEQNRLTTVTPEVFELPRASGPATSPWPFVRPSRCITAFPATATACLIRSMPYWSASRP